MGNCFRNKNCISHTKNGGSETEEKSDSVDPSFINDSFILAVQSGDLIKVSTYISLGADVNYQDPKSKNTGLMIASHSGDHVICEVLLDHGACPFLRNIYGYTAISFAARNGHVDIGRLLLSKSRILQPHPLKKTTPDGSVASMINGTSTIHHETPLMQAVYGGHRDFIIMLLEKGANPNSRTKYGWTPIEFAKAKGNLNILYLFADPEFLKLNTPRCLDIPRCLDTPRCLDIPRCLDTPRRLDTIAFNSIQVGHY